jgi:hypothetical protein
MLARLLLWQRYPRHHFVAGRVGASGVESGTGFHIVKSNPRSVIATSLVERSKLTQAASTRRGRA